MNIAVSGNNVNTAPFTPSLSPVTSTSHVRINTIPIIVAGDLVTAHVDTTVTPNVTHADAKMVSSMQNYVRINGDNIIINGDEADCLTTHTIIATGYVQIN